MSDWLKSASATFAGGAVAIGLVAIPTFIWLPREFDDLYSRIDNNFAVTTGVSSKVDEGLAKLSRIEDLLVTEIQDTKLTIEMLGYLAAALDIEGRVRDKILIAKMPDSTLAEWRLEGKLDYFKGAIVNGSSYIFIDNFDVSRVSQNDIDALLRASASDGFEFRIWDTTLFPGADFDLIFR